MSISPGPWLHNNKVLSFLARWNTKMSNDDYCNCCSICLPPPPLSHPVQSPPPILSNLPSADFPWVFSCNYPEHCVIGFHGDFLRSTSKYVIGEWLIDLGDLGIACVVCSHLTFGPSLCSVTTQQTVALTVVELRRLWVFPLCLQIVPSFVHPLSSQSCTQTSLIWNSPSVHWWWWHTRFFSAHAYEILADIWIFRAQVQRFIVASS